MEEIPTNTPTPEEGATATPEQENVEPTQTPNVEPTTPPAQEKEKTYTKPQVIEMMRARINRSHNAFFKRYGVKDLNELDARFAKIAEYEKQIADLGVTNSGLVRDNAYLKHNIEPNRYGDVEAYFKGKGLKIDSDTLAQEIATHPEWVKAIMQPAPKTTIQTLSPERGHHIVETDEEKANRIFGKI